MIHTPRNGQKFLAVDPSSEHMAYCVVDLQSNGTASLEEAGMIWCGDKWSHGKRFLYVHDCVKHLTVANNISHIKTEAYFAPFNKRQQGTTIIPSINAIFKMMAYSLEKTNRMFVSVEEISPSAWRKTMAISGVKDAKGKKDYKDPTRYRVEQYLGKIFPEEITSNITFNKRQMPNDISDVVAIALSVCVELRCSKIIANKELFNNLSTIKLLNSMV